MTCKDLLKSVTTFFMYELIRQDSSAREAFENWFRQTFPKAVFVPNIENINTGEPDIFFLPALDKYIKKEVWPAVIDYLDETSVVCAQVFLKLPAEMIFDIQEEEWPAYGEPFPLSSALRERLRQGAAAQLLKKFQGRTDETAELSVVSAIGLFVSMYIDNLAEKFWGLRNEMIDFALSEEVFA